MDNQQPTATYDSRKDTTEHINRVLELMTTASLLLMKRGFVHDQSKLESPEKEVFDEYTPQLKATTYDSDEYKAMLAKIKPALDHHYMYNSHHPEHYHNGIEGMDLLDLVEMLMDWKAASERHADGNINHSLEANIHRFKMSPQLASIFANTIARMGWSR